MCLWERKGAREIGNGWIREILKTPVEDSRSCHLVKLHGEPISPQFMNERTDGHFFRLFVLFHIDEPKFIDIEEKEG